MTFHRWTPAFVLPIFRFSCLGRTKAVLPSLLTFPLSRAWVRAKDCAWVEYPISAQGAFPYSLRMGHEPTPLELMAEISLHSAAAPRVLVVDDEEAFRFLNTHTLRRFGYEVDEADDGAIAWKMLQLKRYDILITDNNMPKITGIELLDMLRAAHLLLPVIMATGKAPRDELACQTRPQPDAMLIKPYTRKALLEAVQSVLGHVNLTTTAAARAAAKIIFVPFVVQGSLAAAS